MISIKKYRIGVTIITTAILLFVIRLSVFSAGQTGGDKSDYNVKVIEFYPVGVVSEPVNITVKFSKDLVPDDSLNKLITDIPLKFEPSISGLARWIARNELRYYPDSMFAPSTEYKITVESNRSYLDGNRIKESRGFEFRTPVLIVEHLNPEIINVPERPNQNRLLLHIGFNYPVDYDELTNHLKSNMEKSGKQIKFQIRDQLSSRQFTLISEPFKPQNIHGKFLFTITSGLHCIGGRIPLQEDFNREFNVPKPQPFVISNVRPEVAGKNGKISVRLSQSAALKDIEEYVSLVPDVAITIDQRYRLINIYGNFKPGEVYTVNIRRGLSSLNGQKLERDFSTNIQMPNLRPNLKFADEGYFLPKDSNRLIALETVNIDEISIEVEQVFVNNIAYYLSDQHSRSYYNNLNNVGWKIFSKDYVLPSRSNEPVTSTFNLGEIVSDSMRGIYVVSARTKNQRWNYAQRRIMITDLGMIARLSDNYLMVWVNSLSEIEPVNNARVSLISVNNQLLCDGYTNSDGVAIFKDIGTKLEEFTPLVITVSKGEDLSNLKFSDCLLPSAEFNMKGRPFLVKGYEAFIYSDRGVYRPGEIAHLVSVVCGKNGTVPEEFPYLLTLLDPQGREFRKLKLSTKYEGLEAADIDIPSFAKTGAYKVRATIGDDIIGEYTFQVEDFIPDRIKTTVTTDKDSYSSGERMAITVNGTYLFGAPCDGNQVNGRIEIEPESFSAKAWPEYDFNASEMKFTNIKVDLQTASLDENGNYIYEYTIPDNMRPPSALKMFLSATVLESGGRGVSTYKGMMVYPYTSFVGIKRNTEGYFKTGEDAVFSVVAVDKNGHVVPDDSVWVKFYRVIYHTIVKKDNQGIYRYVSEEEDHIIDSSLVAVTDKSAIARFTPMEYGSYRVKAFGSKTKHHVSTSFYVSGWGYAPWAMTNPDRIELELDKQNYNKGETAALLVKAPFAGKLLLTIEQEQVLEYKTYTLDSNTAEIKLDVKQDYSPNVYISATLIKSTNSLERFSPARAYGLVSLNCRNESKYLKLTISAPDEIKPNTDVNIKVKTMPRTRLTVAAVDYGVIQLTDFKTPDPYDFFFGQKRPSLRAYDIYSFIFPNIEPTQSMLSAAGDMAFEARRQRHISPLLSRRVKPVIMWSGITSADSAGIASVDFAVPQYNGKLRVMVAAFNNDACGSKAKDIIVKENIIIQESLPRFITFSDTFAAKVTVFNNTGNDEVIDVTMDVSGSASIISADSISVLIANGQKQTVDFIVLSDDKPGDAVFEIRASAGSEKAHNKVELPNRPPQPLVTKSGSGVITEAEPAEVTAPSDWLEGTAEYQLRISSLPALRFTGSIQYLLRYPYGCLEQTTSRLFPLLYFSDIARVADPGIFGGKGPDYFIAEGIMKLCGMQNSDGGFQYWPGYSVYNSPWAGIYASHFLVEARKAGYYVNDKVYDKLLKFLKRMANDASWENDYGALRIYAAYVLALTDELDNATLTGLKYLNLDKLPLYSRFQYAGAIALSKGPQEALWLIPVEVHPQNYETETGGFFNSSLRANAILLDIFNEIAPNNPSVPVLIEAISEDLCINQWYTTQASAWGLMAIGKFFKSQEIPDYKGTIVVDGQKFKDFGVEDMKIIDSSFANSEIELSINGRGKCYYYWQASGLPSVGPIEEYDRRLQIRREYLADNGRHVNPKSVKLGDQIVVKVTAKALDKNLENVVIDDLLPTCLEIENPRLETSSKLNWLQEQSSRIDYMDIRDDRLLLFTSLAPNQKFTYYYLARIIAAGDFLVPPVAGECMYDPTVRSAGSSGRITVGNIR